MQNHPINMIGFREAGSQKGKLISRSTRCISGRRSIIRMPYLIND